MEVGASGSTRDMFALAVQKKQLDNTREEGKAAVALIESTKAANPPPGTGKHVNIVG